MSKITSKNIALLMIISITLFLVLFFLLILQSTQKETCGGFVGKGCPKYQACVYSDHYSDALGTCQFSLDETVRDLF